MNTRRIENVLIVGAGWVGGQIAVRLAQSGLRAWISDRTQQDAENSLHRLLQASNDRISVDFADRGSSIDWISRVRVAPPLTELRRDPDLLAELPVELVIECVSEQLSLKKRILRQASELFPPPTIIASNTSYFVPSLLSGFVNAPSRFAHIHFHVPVYHDTVTDLVGCAETSPEVLEQLRVLSLRLGQEPLMLRKEHPGYIFNWMLQSLLKSALELAVRDVADPKTIDRSWTAITGMPLGPFGMMDQIGLDVIEQVLSNARWADAWQANNPSTTVNSSVSDQAKAESEQILTMLRQLTNQGQLGVKTGQGFYEYGTD